MTHKPLEVELPVCPRCERVGAQPASGSGTYRAVHFKCTGASKAQHKVATMELRKFREVLTERGVRP